MSMIRSYLAICVGKGDDFAKKELNAHFVGGGKFDDIVEAMHYEMNFQIFFSSHQGRSGSCQEQRNVKYRSARELFENE